MNTLDYLKAITNGLFTTNGNKQITGAGVKGYMNTLLDSLFTPAGTIRIWPGITVPAGWSKCDGSILSQVDYVNLFTALGGPSSPYGVQATTFNIPLIVGAQNIIQAGISTFHLNIVSTPPYALNDVLTTLSPANGIAARFKVIGVGNDFALKMLSSGSGYHAGESYSLRLLDGSLISQMIVIDSAYNLGDNGGEEKHVLTVPEMPSHTHIQNAHSHVVEHATSGAGGARGALAATVPQLDGAVNTGNTTATNQNTGGSLPHNNMPPFVAMNYIIKLY